MGYFDWDFSKLPQNELEAVFKAYDNYNLIGLLSFYVKYKLGSHDYCCAKPFIRDFYTKAIENGEIRRPEE